MGRLIPDLLRAVADGWEQAAGRDPVDEHAAEAVELLDLDQTAANVRVGPVHVYRLWPDGVSDEEKVAILERELLRVALERDRLAEEAFGPVPPGAEDETDPDGECIAHRTDPDDPDEVVVTADVDEDLVIQLGLDLQESRREIEALQAQLAERDGRFPPIAGAPTDAALREQLRVSVALGYPVRWPVSYVAAILDFIERLLVVVDASRTYADLYAGDRAKYCVEPSARALVDAVRTLDGQPLLPATVTAGGTG
ncbi:hypothetical protein [Pseudonocardia sp. D17]|uniref:hypothetical protein n=1 Tax=Pseudonocardia sp. D17 TaxID=882661 RepID=UPI002B391513|nr:hypothetical protein PSD17_55030 [Pseudonocardia sp. D17]